MSAASERPATIRSQAHRQARIDLAAALRLAVWNGFHEGIDNHFSLATPDNPETFLLLVWWQTLEDHTVGFRESDGFVQWRAVLGPLFASPPAVEHYAAAL